MLYSHCLYRRGLFLAYFLPLGKNYLFISFSTSIIFLLWYCLLYCWYVLFSFLFFVLGVFLRLHLTYPKAFFLSSSPFVFLLLLMTIIIKPATSSLHYISFSVPRSVQDYPIFCNYRFLCYIFTFPLYLTYLYI